jgi:hypothetical protein
VHSVAVIRLAHHSNMAQAQATFMRGAVGSANMCQVAALSSRVSPHDNHMIMATYCTCSSSHCIDAAAASLASLPRQVTGQQAAYQKGYMLKASVADQGLVCCKHDLYNRG